MSNSLHAVYNSFTGSQPEMDGRTFVKVCKDSNLYDKKFIQTTLT